MHLFWHRPKEPLRILLQTPVRGWQNGYFVLAGPVKVASHFSTYSTYLIKPLIYDVLFSKSQWFLFAFSCLLVCVFPSFHFFNSNTLVVRWSWSTQFSNGFASLKVTKDQRNVIYIYIIDKYTLDLWWDYVWWIFHGNFCSCTCCLPTFWVWGWRTASVKEETEEESARRIRIQSKEEGRGTGNIRVYLRIGHPIHIYSLFHFWWWFWTSFSKLKIAILGGK